MLINFYKYSFDSKTELIARPDTINFKLGTTSNPKHNGRNGAYVTPFSVSKNYLAQYKLSITYAPNFRYSLSQNDIIDLYCGGKLELLDNEQNGLNDPSRITEAELPRVWPSFGYYGGAREVFLRFDSGEKLGLDPPYIFSIPGNRDFYHSDDDEPVHFNIDNILSGIIENFSDIEILLNSESDETLGYGRAMGRNVSVNVSKYNTCDQNITASIAFNDMIFATFVKCWLNVWTDNRTNKKRCIYFSEYAEYNFQGFNLTTLSSIQGIATKMFKPLFETLKQKMGTDKCISGSSLFCVRLM